MRRALFLALLAPALARAQAVTPSTINFNPTAIGSSACSSSSTTNLTLTFRVGVNGGTTTVSGGSFTIYATTSQTTTQTGNGITICPSSAGVVKTIDAGSSDSLSISVGAAQVVSAAGLQCSETSTPTINVCVHYLPSGTSTPQASAVGTITVSTQPPSAPFIWLIEPANRALFVHWNPGSSGAASTSYQIVAAPTAGGETKYSAKINSVSSDVDGRIDDLTNGTEYSVTVVPFSAADDAGPASNAVLATPVETQGYWDRYKSAGGKEQGGCASGPGGMGALLLAAAGLARLRRRS